MKLKVYEDSQNYAATVIKLPVKQKVQGLDNLVKVSVFGNDVLIGKESDPEDLYIFFPAESRLSNEFCRMNNLYRDSTMNVDNTQKGFFEDNNRIKALKIRGVISTGFIIPLGSLISLFHFGDTHYIQSQLKVGDEFNKIEGVEICKKYINRNTQTPGTPAEKSKQDKVNDKLKDLIIPNQFRFHDSTSHLAKNLHVINPGDIIAITDKWHGSSCILAKVYVNRNLTWYQKLINKIGGKVPAKEHGYVYSSGKPKSNKVKGVESIFEEPGKGFYDSNIWKKALSDYKHTLEDGISIYSELVGFTESGSGIQGLYDYGCSKPDNNGNGVLFDGQNPHYKMIVYRITYTKPDGNVIEFSWNQIKDYCKKHSLEHVKEFYFGRAGFINPGNILTGTNEYDESTLEEWRIALFDKLQTSFNMEKSCGHCKNKLPAEGIVLRKDGLSTFSAYKLKSRNFLKYETDELDKGEVNIEDQN